MPRPRRNGKIMAKYTITIKSSLDDLIKEIQKTGSLAITKAVAKQAASALITAMKREVAQGKSTISGNGPFGAYRGSYRDQINKKGFINVKGQQIPKRLRPVNLKLTGKFMQSLRMTKIIKTQRLGYNFAVGFTSQRSKDIHDGLRDGRHGRTDSVPRPIIPGTNETFKQPLIRLIDSIYARRLESVLNSITKKRFKAR